MAEKPILVYMATNNCARIMLYLKLNGLEDMLDVKSPKDFGGLQSEEYAKINPQKKFPALILPGPDGNKDFLFESQVILDYIVDITQHKELAHPCVIASSGDASASLLRAKARMMIQVHDLYIASANCTQPGYFATQGCMYKSDMGIVDRSAKSLELRKQLDVLEDLFDKDGPYAAGSQLTLADLAIFPTMIFIVMLVQKSLGWEAPETSVFSTRPKLKAWFEGLEKNLPAFAEVGADVRGFCNDAFYQNGRCEEIRKVVDSDEGKALSW